MDSLAAEENLLEPRRLAPQVSLDSLAAPPAGRFKFSHLQGQTDAPPQPPRPPRQKDASKVPERLLKIAAELRAIDEADDTATIAALQRHDLTKMTEQIRDIEKARRRPGTALTTIAGARAS